MGFNDKDRLLAGGLSTGEANAIELEVCGAGNSGQLGTGMFFNTTGNFAATAGNPIAANSADTNDDVVFTFVIPANALDKAGRMINIQAQGQSGATTNNKRAKIWANPTIAAGGGTTNLGHVTAGTLLADTGSWVNATTPNNNVGWQLQVDLTKYGASGSNTQIAQQTSMLNTLHGGTGSSTALTLAENAAITIAITVSSPTTGAANDMLLDQVQCQFFN